MRLTSILLLGFFCKPLSAVALEHPPMLGEQDGCNDWIGSARGNDPSVRLNVQLCSSDSGEVHGTIQWSSLQSGWNIRAVEGRWNGDQLTLRDVSMRESHPERGWRFCPIDAWSLERRGDSLAGNYTSGECDDHATVSLRRISTREGRDAEDDSSSPRTAQGPAQKNHRPDRPDQAATEPPSSRADEGFGGCSLENGGGDDDTLLWSLGGWACWAFRRRWARD